MINLVEMKWATEQGDSLLGHMARVSNPNASPEDDASKLIRFLIDHNHWSPFEMVNLCVSIHTTRDVGRQILRHRSFSFQEFSQRYAEVSDFETIHEMRRKGSSNRQGSLDDRDMLAEANANAAAYYAIQTYRQLISAGVAAETARAVLPEGYTPTHMYMNGTVRSWIHYLKQRLDPHTQKEHRLVAIQINEIFAREFPDTAEAAGLYL